MEDHAKTVQERFEWLLRVARERPSRHELAVAVALASHVNIRSGHAWPSARRLAELAGLDLRHAWRALRRLRDAGLVHVADPGGPARSAIYALDQGPVQTGVQTQASHPEATQRRTQRQRSVAPRGDAALHPGATEHGANAKQTRSGREVRALRARASPGATRSARRAPEKQKPKPKPF